jgi:DUF4097 and DUF4098 domain-containing protein YvlB
MPWPCSTRCVEIFKKNKGHRHIQSGTKLMARTRCGVQPTLVMLAICASVTAFAETKKTLHFALGPHAAINIVNQFGAVTITPSTTKDVDVTATLGSDKVEVDPTRNGNRLELRTHFLQTADSNQGRVDYAVKVPTDTSVTVRSASGPISAEGLRADVVLEGDAAEVHVKQVRNSHVHIRTLNGAITLEDINYGHVEITSVSGPVMLTNVDGPAVTVNTTSGKIMYTGDFGEGGEYSLTNHSGGIEVSIPATASLDISARSVNGSVENDFPMKPKPHPSFAITQGKSFAGTLNAGASSVRLHSFSGKIRVKKQ